MDWPPYQVVVRLYMVAEGYWELISSHFYQINLMGEPPHRFCSFIYGWMQVSVPTEKWESVEMELSAPLPGSERKPSENELEEEGQLFMAAMHTLEK